MRIGGFWGFTAPMILLAFENEDEKLLPLLKKLNTTMNREILNDFGIECLKLLSIRSLATVSSNYKDSLSSLYGDSITVDHGEFSCPESLDKYLIEAQFRNELCFMLAEMVVKGEQKGKFISLSGFESIKECIEKTVDNILINESFSINNSKMILRKYYKEMCSEDSISYTSSLIELYDISLVVGDVIIINGKKVELKPLEKSILQYYVDNSHRLYKYLEFINVGVTAEETVFGNSFYDVVKRKPVSLHYMVLNRFDFLKAKQNKNLFLNIVNDVKTDIDKYKDCLQKNIHIIGTESDVNVVSSQVFQDFLSKCDTKKASFFRKANLNGVLNLSDILESDLESLSLLYDFTSKVDSEFLNMKFNCNLSTNEWNELGYSLIEFGLYGLNANTLSLFRESLSVISLLASDKIEKSEESMLEINNVIADVEALISTLKPIGEVLK